MALIRCTYNPRNDISLKISDLTNGRIQINSDDEYYWNGTEILDTFLHVLGSNLKTQYDNQWITGGDYAQAYIKMMEIASVQSLRFLELQRNLLMNDAKNELDACLQNNKLQLEEMKVESDIALANRQIQGYDDNLIIKLLQAELDAFALIYSSGMLDNPDLGPLNVTNLYWAFHMLAERVPDSNGTYQRVLKSLGKA